VGLRLDFQLSARTSWAGEYFSWGSGRVEAYFCATWRLPGNQDYSEKIMQRPYQPMRGENKCSVPNVCPQCHWQTVVPKTFRPPPRPTPPPTSPLQKAAVRTSVAPPRATALGGGGERGEAGPVARQGRVNTEYQRTRPRRRGVRGSGRWRARGARAEAAGGAQRRRLRRIARGEGRAAQAEARCAAGRARRGAQLQLVGGAGGARANALGAVERRAGGPSGRAGGRARAGAQARLARGRVPPAIWRPGSETPGEGDARRVGRAGGRCRGGRRPGSETPGEQAAWEGDARGAGCSGGRRPGSGTPGERDAGRLADVGKF
jgi:hypothetical protein